MPLVVAAGDAFQFDWSEDFAILSGKQTKLQVAHTKLSHSRAFIVRAFPLQTHHMLSHAVTQAFRVLGGVPQRGIFDKMKTAVDRIALLNSFGHMGHGLIVHALPFSGASTPTIDFAAGP